MVASTYQEGADDALCASSPNKMPKSKAQRMQQVFWLNVSDHSQQWLQKQIKALKQERQYSRAVRDGLRLFLDLRDGNLDVLFELFPFVKERIDTLVMARIIEYQQDMIRSFTSPQPAKVTPIGQGALKPVTPPAPDDDDTLLTVTKAQSDGKSGENFLKSAFSLVQ